MREINKGMDIALKYVDSGIIYGKQNRASLEIHAYKDSSLESNDYLSSQLGYVVLFCDSAGICHVIDYSSWKLRRVAK